MRDDMSAKRKISFPSTFETAKSRKSRPPMPDTEISRTNKNQNVNVVGLVQATSPAETSMDEWNTLRQKIKSDFTRISERRKWPHMSRTLDKPSDVTGSTLYWLYKFSLNLHNDLLREREVVNKHVRQFMRATLSCLPSSVSQDDAKRKASNIQLLLKSRERTEKEILEFFTDFYLYVKQLLFLLHSIKPNEKTEQELNIAKRHLHAGQIQTKNLSESTQLIVTTTKQFYIELCHYVRDKCSADEYKQFLRDVQKDDVINESASPNSKMTHMDRSYKGKEKYCVCREVFYGKMIACDSDVCTIEWFHYECLGIQRTPKGSWFCPVCSDLRDIENDGFDNE